MRKLILPCALALACSGKPKSHPIGPGSGSAGPPVDAAEHTPVEPEDAGGGATGPAAVNHLPELFPPLWKSVGIGQTVSFSVAAIDQDLDEVKVEVASMPASAKFDPITQTVTWTPTKADGDKGSFELHVTELASGAMRSVTWDLPVSKKKVAPPVAPYAGDAAETLFTIREPKRVEATAKAYPFDALLLWSATEMRTTLPPEVQQKLGKLDKAALFKSFLKGLAATHQNPRLDPDAKEFDKASFGSPKDWRLIVIRPRIDKKFHELRLVYQAVKAPEPVFAMFRVRLVWDIPTLPPEARVENNKAFDELYWKNLLTADGGVNPKFVKDPAAHGKAVLAFVKGVLSYKGTEPWGHSAFIALPTEARMGGGSARSGDGTYASGDGWAWAVEKPMVAADGAGQAYVDIGIPGFWTMAVPSPDKSTWVPKCAPAFDADAPEHVAGYEVLCRKALGFVDLPDTSGGKVATSKIDAVNLFKSHKQGDSVAQLALDDGRRDLGEENGMTCAQCHMRNFGQRDYGDAATVDPKQGTPKAPNHPIATLDFQIIPTQRWEAFTLDFMQDQECKAKAQLEAELGKPTQLTCALADPSTPRHDKPLEPGG